MDVSFISIKLILPALFPCLREGAQVVALIKPQFEAGREKVGKKGVVRDEAVHKEVLLSIMDFARTAGYSVLGWTIRPSKGRKGTSNSDPPAGKSSQGLDAAKDVETAQKFWNRQGLF